MKTAKKYILEPKEKDVYIKCPYCEEDDCMIVKRSTTKFTNTCYNCGRKYNVVLRQSGIIQYELLDK